MRLRGSSGNRSLQSLPCRFQRIRDKDLSVEQFVHAAHYLLASALTQTKNNLSPCPDCKLAVWRFDGRTGLSQKIRCLCRQERLDTSALRKSNSLCKVSAQIVSGRGATVDCECSVLEQYGCDDPRTSVSLARQVPEMLCTLLFTTFEQTSRGSRCTGCSYIRRFLNLSRPPNWRQYRGSRPMS